MGLGVGERQDTLMAHTKNCWLQLAGSILSFCFDLPFMAQAENDQLRANDRAAFEEEFHKLTMDSKELKVFIGIAQMALGAFGYGTGPFDGTMDDKTTSAI